MLKKVDRKSSMKKLGNFKGIKATKNEKRMLQKKLEEIEEESIEEDLHFVDIFVEAE